MSTDHALPSELTIYNVGELLPQFRAAQPDDTGVLRMHASEVAEVDAAGIQLLLSLAKSLQARNGRLELVDASAGLSAACEAIGVASQLTWTSGGATHAQ